MCGYLYEFHAACVEDDQQILGVGSSFNLQGTRGSNAGLAESLLNRAISSFLSSEAFSSFTEFKK